MKRLGASFASLFVVSPNSIAASFLPRNLRILSTEEDGRYGGEDDQPFEGSPVKMGSSVHEQTPRENLFIDPVVTEALADVSPLFTSPPIVEAERGRSASFRGFSSIFEGSDRYAIDPPRERDVYTFAAAAPVSATAKFLANITTDGALNVAGSFQNNALKALESSNPNLDPANPADQNEIISRYGLNTLYFATQGATWTNATGWTTALDPCTAWYGVVCNEGVIEGLVLPDNNLANDLKLPIDFAGIPSEVSAITSLTTFIVTRNFLSGYLPTHFGRLSALNTLRMSDNFFELTPFPNDWVTLTNLGILDLELNGLSGTIPTVVGALTILSYLDYSQNLLNGAVPTDLGNLINLQVLRLQGNKDLQDFPSDLGLLTALTELNVRFNNFDKALPDIFGALSNLEILDLGDNFFADVVPSSIFSLTKLKRLNLDLNEFADAFPTTLNLPVIEGLNMFNMLDPQLQVATLPTAFFGLSTLTSLNIGGNGFVLLLPSLSSLSLLQVFEANNNLLSGGIPTSYALVTTLNVLNLAGNYLNSSVPSELGLLTNLTRLDLTSNEITGELPSELGMLTSLTSFGTGLNPKLEGAIPTTFASLTNLVGLSMDLTNITGTIPTYLGNFKNLATLYLNNTELTGNVPSELGTLTKLLTLCMQNTNIKGTIPTALGSLQALRTSLNSDMWLIPICPLKSHCCFSHSQKKWISKEIP
jgi:Leucine-rich repeat (LRR) protein